jgi:hypothetical protein
VPIRLRMNAYRGDEHTLCDDAEDTLAVKGSRAESTDMLAARDSTVE